MRLFPRTGHDWPGDIVEDTIQNLRRSPHCASEEYEKETILEKPIWKQLTFHHFGLILSATFGALAVAIAFFLVLRHATHYLKPYEQKHIIRILVMIPIYAVVSFLSYLYYHHAIYFELLRDCYEAFAIASFFTLMCHYIAPNLHEQKEYFRNVEPKNWVWPINWMQKCSGGETKGWLRKPLSGLTWFNVVWISIFQYCFVRPFFTLVAVIAQTQSRYCQGSTDPRFAYLWVAVFQGISVTIAMYCLIQFYVQLKDDLAPHRPFLKVLCIKLVIFFCFWQSWIISLLTGKSGPLKASEKIAGPDLRIGIPSMLTCVEMAIFAVMHLFAFPWKPYDLRKTRSPTQAPPGSIPTKDYTRYAHGPARALLDALNPWDIIKACGRGFRWLTVGVRNRRTDPSYQKKLEPTPSETGYGQGPTFAGNGEAAMEFTKFGKASDKTGSEDSDTIGLLSHAQTDPYVQQGSYHVADDRSYGYYSSHSPPSGAQPGPEYDLGTAYRGRNG
ncbi:organic solute transporter Ostalpha-domain-containing protein [Massariosphaeria phaeospora]|uniref:Organic solute transporter Ostalpha-domain-containing protein n=1 Tax=Massariosphaeria phaeospora TaxID=100035 RepID=A0A7C8IEQ9_9PLEO|nr:organic solute transporter Ostalpha-domain-containing protein [Massariosphaeria phaeospora]